MNGRFVSAVLLAADNTAKIADVGLARFMPNDYLSSQAAVGTFAWAVGGLNPLGLCNRALWDPAVAAPHSLESGMSAAERLRGSASVVCSAVQAPEVLMGEQCSSKVDVYG